MSAERDERRDRELLAIAHAMVGLDHPIKDDTSAWARENLAQRDVIASDAACEFPVKDWRQCADRGLRAEPVGRPGGDGESDCRAPPPPPGQ